MKKIVIPTAAAALFAAMSIANAASATGMIKSIDISKDTVTLDNGMIYWAPATVKISNFKVGEKVKITYTQTNGKMQLSALTPAA
jgi:Cu/Ag efflux protein CusF